MNTYVSLCLAALITITLTAPKNDDVNEHDIYLNDNPKDYDFNSSLLMKDHHQNQKVVRQLQNIIDGTEQYIKIAGISYRQRIQDNQCVVEYNHRYVSENGVIQIRKKLYRVEKCLLERVFHACGPNLLMMLNVVCRLVDQYKHKQASTTPTMVHSRQTMPASLAFLHRLYTRADKTPRVITESCCESLCTVSELTRYCYR